VPALPGRTRIRGAQKHGRGSRSPLPESRRHLGKPARHSGRRFSHRPFKGDHLRLYRSQPNVFYEIGIAHTLGRDVILITQIEPDIPFDLLHLRYLHYLNNAEGLAALDARLRAREGRAP
jgi:hypothetical protein